MKPLKTISVLAMVFLVLLSSSNFMVGIHFCSGEIQNIGFLKKADVCEREQSLPPCHKHTTAPCCEDKTIVHQAEDLKAYVPHFHVAAPVTMEVADFDVLVSEVVPSSPVFTAFYLYDPPRRSHDIIITNQVFLI